MERPDQTPPDDTRELGVEEDLDILDAPDVPDEVKAEVDERAERWRDEALDDERPNEGPP